jgi:hypothetical protein
MRVESIRTLAGPNVYSHRPVLLVRLDLEGLYEKESYEVSGFVERLLALLPGLGEHHCSKGYAGEGRVYHVVIEFCAEHAARVMGMDVCGVDLVVLDIAEPNGGGGAVVRRGLGYDWADVGVMTNVGADHIGQDGIKSVEDILWIKSLVAVRGAG